MSYAMYDIMNIVTDYMRPTFFRTVLSILSYILLALGYHTLAKRRKLPNAWLAWVPFFNSFLLGYLSDAYQLREYNRVTCRGHWLRYFTLSLLSTCLICWVLLLLGAFNGNRGFAVFLKVVAVITILIQLVANTVFLIISLYDVYRSTVPRYAVLLVVLSILFNFLLPFFIFCIRSKGYGESLSGGVAPAYHKNDGASPAAPPAAHENSGAPSAAALAAYENYEAPSAAAPAAEIPAVTCPFCGEAMSSEDRFCPGCGREVAVAKTPESCMSVRGTAKICPHCGQILAEGDLFCPDCGRKVIAAEPDSFIGANESEKAAEAKNLPAADTDPVAAEDNKPRIVSTVRKSAAATEKMKTESCKIGASESRSNPFSAPKL